MKEITCYKLNDGSLYEDKEEAIEAQQRLNNKKTIDHTQNISLAFKEEDLVYVAFDDAVRQCKVTCIIAQHISRYSYTYDDDVIEICTAVELEDINEKKSFRYSTGEYNRDLNLSIKTNPLDLFNFNYEKSL